MKKLIYLSLSLAVIISCQKDFIVKNIKDKTITVNAPADNLVTSTNLVTFWWEPLDGAEKYNLQIVKPSFSAVTQLIMDTSITVTKFNVSLLPGNYQWRIKGTNAGGATAFQTYNLKIDTTSNLTAQLVNPLTPVNGYLTGTKTIFFSWSLLNSASQYEIQINNGAIKDTITTLTTYSCTLPIAAGITTGYTWRVKALNAFSISQYNTAQTFTIDLTSPSSPLLTTPNNASSVKDTVKLVWNRIGAPDAKYDSILVASDSLFVNIISKTITYQQSIKINQLTNPPPATNTNYWWKLRSVDSVRNVSAYSSYRKFTLIP